MYSITPEHAIGLVGGLLALAVVLFARRLHPRWRLVPGTVQAAALLITTVLGYLVYVGIGFEGPDQVGLATKLVEVTALGLALVPVRGEKGRTHRSWRWASLGVAMPL